MRELHPDVQTVRDTFRELEYRIDEMREKVESIVARRPSPSGLAIPEVDAFGRLRDLYLAPGTCARLDNDELAADITAAVVESAEDARRQYRIFMHDRSSLPRPLAEVMRERRRAGRQRETPSSAAEDENRDSVARTD